MYTPYLPPKILQPYVAWFFTIHWKRNKNDPPFNELALPSGTSFSGFRASSKTKIIINNNKKYLNNYYTIGQQTKMHYVCPEGTISINSGIAYTPTGLWHLFKPNMLKLVNEPIVSDLLFNDKFKEFKEDFNLLKQPEKRVKAIEKLLINQVKTAQPKLNIIDTAVRLINTYKGCVSIKDLVKQLHISERYFQKMFKKMVGITPSTYTRIIRFNYLFAEMNSKTKQDYKTLNMLYNYYDFAHFSKDFKRYCGESPSKFHIEKFHFLKSVWVDNPFVEVE